MSNLVEPLLRTNAATGLPEGAAAERWDVAEDGLSITFTLRPDLRWSDGERITAADFAFALSRLLEPRFDAWIAPQLSAIRNAVEYHEGAILPAGQLGVKAVDDRTLRVDLKRKEPAILQVFSLPVTAPISKKALDRAPRDWTRPDKWVGSGPFVPAEAGKTVYVLRKNPRHRLAPQIGIDEVHVFLVASPAEGVAMYEDRTVDQFGYRDFDIPGAALARLAGRKDVAYQTDFRTFFLRFNPLKAPLSRKKLRQSFAMAIDRELLLRSVLFRHEPAAFSILPPALKLYEPPPGYLQNGPGARIEMKELGYCTRGYSPKGCNPIPMIDLIHRAEPEAKKLALFLAANWRKVLGADRVQVQEKEPDEFQKAVRDGNFVMALDDIAVEPERAFDMLRAFRTGRATAGGLSNKLFDELVDAAHTQAKWSDSKAMYRQAEALLLREAFVVPLFYGTVAYLSSPQVCGYDPNIWDLHPYSLLSIARK